ncbi:MAG: DUF6785 family protein [Armatimonadota bacterium]
MTGRSVAIGLLGSSVVTLWIHQAELILGSASGHTALANTSIPVGAFAGLLALVGVNAVGRAALPRLALSRGETITAYVMMTSSTVLASSGGIHFLVPTLAAAFHFATPTNHWEAFLPYIPSWLAPHDRVALEAFYVGDAPVPVQVWLTPFLVWGGFYLALAFATVCLSAILRREWVDHERLTFPTVVVPLELTAEEQPLFHNRLFWLGAALPLVVQLLNNLHLNYPDVPGLSLRDMEVPAYSLPFPLNAMDYTPVNFYPFVIGIAYLLSIEVTFSYWFFYALTKLQLVSAAAFGWRLPGAPLDAAVPYLPYQGAGAFLAIPLISLWLARDYLRRVGRSVLGLPGGVPGEGREPMPYRWASVGLLASLGAMVYVCWAAGMNGGFALLLLGISLLYILAATRIRAESGTALLFGPDVDPNTLVTTSLGSGYLRPADLTVMAYLRFATTFDLRCLSMPHQLDGFRMAGAANLNMRRLALAMLAAIAVVITVGFWSGLAIWYRLGAAAKTDWWRTSMGQMPFINLSAYLQTPPTADLAGIAFTGLGLLLTCALAFMRARYVWWPFHPVGYAMANTFAWGQLPFPFFIAWATKSLVLRYGGMRLYRQSLPFFLGLIIGDLAGGAFFTLLGGMIRMNVYPINW